MAPTLEDILALPLDVRQEHLAAMGWAPAPPPAPAAAPGPVAGVTGTTPPAAAPQPISPVIPGKPTWTPDSPRAQKLASSVNAPKPVVMPSKETIDANAQGLQAPNLPPGAVPGVESDALKPVPTTALPGLTFKQQQKLPLLSPGVEAGSIQDKQNRLDRMSAQEDNPWGSPGNHDNWLGKLGHYAARAGNIALDVAAPGTASLIPGTDLNKLRVQRGLETGKRELEQAETTREGIEQRPEIAEATGALRERLQEERDRAAEQRETEREKNLLDITGKKTESSEKIAGGKEASNEKISGNKIKSNEEMLRERLASQERIATGRNLAQTEIARIRAASANDPNKLTNTMKTMKQTAQATLPEIDKAMDETERVANELGPTEGRWNDFWTGKVGSENKDFAHYKAEIGFVSTAVTLAHARGRMSNELFEHFNKMFDAGRQDPANMIQALDVAKEWLTGYANMGEIPPAAANTPPANTPPAATPNAPPVPSFKEFQQNRKQQTPGA
jgi:hypothetical protein